MYKVFLILSFIFCFAGTHPEPLVVDIETHLNTLVKKEVVKECPTCDIELYIHNKKIIEDISIPDQVVAERWKGQTNLILKLGEDSRIVTVTIRWTDDVVVASKNLKQGKIITASDVYATEKDVTFLNEAYVNDIKAAVGWEGRKLFRRGQVIDESYLKKPIVVKYGQPVRVFVDQGALSLSMMGKARGAGAIGDQIPIHISDTNKKVTATVIDKSTVRIQ